MFFKILPLILVLFPLIFAGENTKDAGSFNNSIKCFIETETDGIKFGIENVTMINGAKLINSTVMECTDSVEHEKRKCIKVDCQFEEPVGRLIKKDCGTCKNYHDDYAMKDMYSKLCKCYVCDTDYCNSALAKFGHNPSSEYSLICLLATILPPLLLTIFLI